MDIQDQAGRRGQPESESHLLEIVVFCEILWSRVQKSIEGVQYLY